jgi:hypothetical protein
LRPTAQCSGGQEAAADDDAASGHPADAAEQERLSRAAGADILLAARRDHREQREPAGDDLLAAELDNRNRRRSAGRNDLLAAGVDRRARRRPARLDDLRAGEDRGTAGEPRNELRAAFDQSAGIDPRVVNDLDAVAENGRGIGEAAAFNKQCATAADGRGACRAAPACRCRRSSSL